MATPSAFIFEGRTIEMMDNNSQLLYFPAIDDRLRREQTRPETMSMVKQIKERLSCNYDVQESNKYYYQLKVSYNGIKIADYWCKEQYVRFIISKKVLSKISFNLSNRTAFKIIKGQWTECDNEFVLTPDEAEIILSELAK